MAFVGEQLRLPLIGGRITYEQSLLLPLTVLGDGRRVLWARQLEENPELKKLVTGTYRSSFKPLMEMHAWQFRELDGKPRAYEAPAEEWMPWIEGEKVSSRP